jgi:hypothetical protein
LLSAVLVPARIPFAEIPVPVHRLLVSSPLLVVYAVRAWIELALLVIVSAVGVVLSFCLPRIFFMRVWEALRKRHVWNGPLALYADVERSELRDLSFVITRTKDACRGSFGSKN